MSGIYVLSVAIIVGMVAGIAINSPLGFGVFVAVVLLTVAALYAWEFRR